MVDDDYLRLAADGVEYHVGMDKIAACSDGLIKATRQQRQRYEVSVTGTRWPEVDEDRSIR